MLLPGMEPTLEIKPAYYQPNQDRSLTVYHSTLFTSEHPPPLQATVSWEKEVESCQNLAVSFLLKPNNSLLLFPAAFQGCCGGWNPETSEHRHLLPMDLHL